MLRAVPFKVSGVSTLTTAGTATSDALTVQEMSNTGAVQGRDEIGVHLEITPTLNVDFQVRLHPSLSFVSVQAGITASTIIRVGLAHQMRILVNSGGGSYKAVAYS